MMFLILTGFTQFLKQQKVAWYLKHFISTRQHKPKNRCLVVVHSRDSDTLKQIILDIDHLFKKASGRFVDGSKVECTVRIVRFYINHFSYH